MDWYGMIKRFYERTLWNLSMVKDAVICKKITEKEYKEITGLAYEVDSQE